MSVLRQTYGVITVSIILTMVSDDAFIWFIMFAVPGDCAHDDLVQKRFAANTLISVHNELICV